MLLLSGGEKALAAVALLMAIFKYQPSPFCVLDEVDAPLDEANIGRLTRLLAEMSANTQFIVITHSKRTMEVGAGAVRRDHAGARRLAAGQREIQRRRSRRVSGNLPRKLAVLGQLYTKAR